MRRTLRRPCSSLMHCSIGRQHKSLTIYSINHCCNHPTSVFANAQSKPRQLLAGFCLARKLCFLDGFKKNVSTRLLSFGYGFDCGRRPAFSSASLGSRGEPRFYARRSFFHAEPPGQSCIRRAGFCRPGSGPCRSIPRAGRQRRSGREASVRRGVESTGKYKSVHGLYRTASHRAFCLVCLVGGADLAANGVPFCIAEF